MKEGIGPEGRIKRLKEFEFIVNNIGNMPLDELAKKLGITKKSLKGYFPGIRWLLTKKEDIFLPHIKGEARKTKIILCSPRKISPKRVRHFLARPIKRRP